MSSMIELLNRLAETWIARDRAPDTAFAPATVFVRPDGLDVAGSFRHADATGPGALRLDLDQSAPERFAVRVTSVQVPAELGPDLAPFRDVLERLAVTADLDFSGEATLRAERDTPAAEGDRTRTAGDPGDVTAPRPSAYPLLDLLSAVATRQIGARPGASERVRVVGLRAGPAGLSVQLQVKDPFGKPTPGAVEARVESVGADHAYLALQAVGGRGFRAVVGTLLKAGTLVEPLLRAVLGRSLLPGIKAQHGHLKLTYAPFLDGLVTDDTAIIDP